MKIRSGFVSNSSSSSFVIGIKGDKTLGEFLDEHKDRLIAGLPEENALSGIVADLLEELVMEIVSSANATFETEEDVRGLYMGDYDEDDWVPTELALIRRGFTVYRGYWSDEGSGSMETMLCDRSLNFDSENFVIEHEGGY